MFNWANEDSRMFLSRGYLLDGETVESRGWDMAQAAQDLLPKTDGFADKFYRYYGLGYYSISSPVQANFGRERGLPISCNNSFISDSIDSLLYTTAEIGTMTKHGAGTSAYMGAFRPRGSEISSGGKSDGPVHFASMIETVIDVISQGNVRRGNAAIYLDVEHPDVGEFLDCREEGSPIQKLSLGVCISDSWMQSMIDGCTDKRKVWARIIKKRFESGYPYIVFSDTVNRNAPDVYKDKGRKINGSNLCSEIALSSNEDESFVCNLASMNLLEFDNWKDTDAVEVLVQFLDAVMTEYINKTSGIRFMERAHRFAVNQRAIGIGTLGYHSYLQANMIPFESMEAKLLNSQMHKLIATTALSASKELADVYGEPPMLEGYGRRNVTLMAIAPTTSSSFILGQVSPSVEPLASNYFTKDLAKGKFTYKNPYLVEVLEGYGRNDEQTWRGILELGGSVQHLDFLTDHERNVFKTFGEISQLEIVQQAAARQKFVDQSQSLNLMIHPDTPLKEVNQLMIDAWRMGVKSLYYQRGTNPAQDLVRKLNACSVCEA